MVSPNEYFNVGYFTRFYNEHLKTKKGGGRDGLTPNVFWRQYKDELGRIANKCLSGEYKFSPYRERLVLKGKDKNPRVLSIPSMRDRLVLGVLNKYLQDAFPKAVAHEVPNKCIEDLRIFMENNANKPLWYLKTDIRSFYDELDLDLLYDKLQSAIDPYMLALVKKAINTATIADGVKANGWATQRRSKGVPQGLAISNILAGIYMQDFDYFFTSARKPVELYKRYVDDILVLSTKEINDEFISYFKVELILKCSTLRLSVNKTEHGMIGQSNVYYIGYNILSALKISVHPKNVQRYLKRLSGMITRYRIQKENPSHRPRFISEDTVFDNYYVYNINKKIAGLKASDRLYGWMPYFQSSTDLRMLYEMDSTIHKKFLKGCCIESKILHLPKVYWDIKKYAGKHTLVDFDTIKDNSQKRAFLADVGIIDKDMEYSDEEINNIYSSHIESSKKDALLNIGSTY